MINKILTAYSQQMEHHLCSFFRLPEGIVEIGSIPSLNHKETNRLVISLLNLERETAQGIRTPIKAGSENMRGISLPSVHMNMYVIIAAVFSDKQYSESLSLLSQAITFMQANSSFTLPDEGKFTIELVNTTLQDLNNIWSGLGNHHYPSVVCKIRGLTFSADQIQK